ncbi:MAG: MBL fold metallo-hydrolase [Acidimicrobiales bacterium]
MRVRVWGCRGSLAAPGPTTVRYGGHTSCVEVQAGDERLVLDAGSGIRALGDAILRDAGSGRPVHVLLSHLHLDHLQGLAFFAPLWRSGVELHIWGPPSPTHSLKDRVATYFSPPLFPIHLVDVPSRVEFHDAPDEAWGLGAFRVEATSVSHQGPTLGYRIEHDGHVLAYLPDHEPALGISLAGLDPTWISGFVVADGADVLLHDSQYSEDEYADHVGWGHSSIEHVVTLARKADVGQLVLFHHDPAHDDEDLDRLLDRAVELWGEGGHPPVLAHDGMVLDLPA